MCIPVAPMKNKGFHSQKFGIADAQNQVFDGFGGPGYTQSHPNICL